MHQINSLLSNNIEYSVNVDTSEVVSMTHPTSFLSVTLDAEHFKHPNFDQLRYNLSDPRLVNLVKYGLSPAFLRIGGTNGDYLTYNINSGPQEGNVVTKSAMDCICDFAHLTNLSLVFGLNNEKGYNDSSTHAWNSTNAESLVRYAVSIKCPIVGWELGNEDDLLHQPGKEYFTPLLDAQHFVTLNDMLTRIYGTGSIGAGTITSPFVIGPDVTHNGIGQGHRGYFLKEFLLNLTSSSNFSNPSFHRDVDVVTWHHYFGRGSTLKQLTTPPLLNTLKHLLASANATVAEYNRQRSSPAQLWLGESGLELNNKSSNSTSGPPGLNCGKHTVGVDCYWGGVLTWLDKLGLAARFGHAVVARQSLSHLVIPDYRKNMNHKARVVPEYWASVLIKQLLGPEVLNVTVHGLKPDWLRVYAHCARPTVSAPSAMIIMLLNLQNESVNVTLPHSSKQNQRELYMLTSFPVVGNMTSYDVALNGIKLKPFDDGSLPKLQPTLISHDAPIVIPNYSVAFVKADIMSWDQSHGKNICSADADHYDSDNVSETGSTRYT